MPNDLDPKRLTKEIADKYRAYLRATFHFKDRELRESFERALEDYELQKGPFPEEQSPFNLGVTPFELAQQLIDGDVGPLEAALFPGPLYLHQEKAIRALTTTNIVVATGTASGKTECFLYPVLFDLYRQHLLNELSQPGVRAMVLYPMNALANDQRRRLGEISENLQDQNSDFQFTFGQYIGETPENLRDDSRNGREKGENRLPGELVFREEMRENPPHILLTNYSMLEYLLIRPNDSKLFDDGRSMNWRFLILDEAHQYRGARRIEMGMLIRRLKDRLRKGGMPDNRDRDFRCIATSATIASGTGEYEKRSIAKFSEELFGEPFGENEGVIFEEKIASGAEKIQRHHIFLRALEGAFIVYPPGGPPEVKLERSSEENSHLFEIALCRECGQHYIVGRTKDSVLREAVRDPSHPDFGVSFYMPIDSSEIETSSHKLCQICGMVSLSSPGCGHDNYIPVMKCLAHPAHPDRLKECASCGYHGIDPVQEVIHGSDGPNSVIVTALHRNLPKNRRKILAFSDSRQEAAFFAWYAQRSYEDIRDRNLILRALGGDSDLSLEDMKVRIRSISESSGIFEEPDTKVTKERKSLRAIYREFFTDERRISLEGVGLVRWYPQMPENFVVPEILFDSPWNFTEKEAKQVICILLNYLRADHIARLPDSHDLTWDYIGLRTAQSQSVCLDAPRGRRNVSSWTGNQRKTTQYLVKLLSGIDLDPNVRITKAQEALREIWEAIKVHDRGANDNGKIFLSHQGLEQMNLRWWRIDSLQGMQEIYQCQKCNHIQWHNVKGACTRHGCAGSANQISMANIKGNHYRRLYEDMLFPAKMISEEHTAQLTSDAARQRQHDFMEGRIHTLSSSTTFEMGVDLGDLNVVFMRNVPPETFNYSQRVGRAGRRGPGVSVTYCRRNPHDLYHFEDPNRILRGKIRPPILSVTNPKIIRRHITAFALSGFFRAHRERFKNVESLIVGWQEPRFSEDFRAFLVENHVELKASLMEIVPPQMADRTGLQDGSWVEDVVGSESRLKSAEDEVVSDHRNLETLENQYSRDRRHREAERARRRARTIETEDTLSFLSRKAIIPKYGFPVDVVSLQIDRELSRNIDLQRDLSLAIAEYAPGSKLVANKKEWQSYGIKKVEGREWRIMNYIRCEKCNFFAQWGEGEEAREGCIHEHRPYKYLVPQFGFLAASREKPKSPQGRTRKLYTTRPCFDRFREAVETREAFSGIRLTQASPGKMVVLCEGRHGEKFHVCQNCGAGFEKRSKKHKSPYGNDCNGTLSPMALGHEFITDVVRVIFPGYPVAGDEYFSHSLATSLVIGASEVLGVPQNDLNAVITHSEGHAISPIVLYDNVPGGAGLVKKLEEKGIFREILEAAQNRVSGDCRCGENESCYGCLRSYRNQYLHHGLQRGPVLEYLSQLLSD